MSNENSNNILVIGNGFDLAHGLKTRYNDFIAYMRNKKYDGRLDDPYAKEIKSIVGVEKKWIYKLLLGIYKCSTWMGRYGKAYKKNNRSIPRSV